MREAARVGLWPCGASVGGVAERGWHSAHRLVRDVTELVDPSLDQLREELTAKPATLK